MEPPRPLDRLDRRIAAARLRPGHVRAIARALAERRDPSGAPASLTSADVFVSRKRGVRLCGADRVSSAAVASLIEEIRCAGRPRRAEQLAASYALHADDYAVYAGLAPLPERGPLIATGGRVASGKTTLARKLARHLAAPRVAGDRVRRRLLESAGPQPAHELAWSEALGERIYEELLARARAPLAAGRPVVLDACFPSRLRRAAAAALAAAHGAPFLFVCCDAPEEDVAARLRLRDVRDGVAPGSWAALAASVDARWEPPDADEPGECRHVDTSRPRSTWLAALGLEQRGVA